MWKQQRARNCRSITRIKSMLLKEVSFDPSAMIEKFRLNKSFAV